MFNQWMKLSSDMVLAHFDAQRVISLRLAKLTRGGEAARLESHRMVVEKMTAAVDAATALASGKTSHSVLRRYRTIMRANQRRLSKPQKTPRSARP
jgi:hypothetical protein